MCGSTSKILSWACTQFVSESLLTLTVYLAWNEIERDEEQKDQEQKVRISRVEHTIQVMVEAGQYQNGSGRRSHFILGPQRSLCDDKKIAGVVDSRKGVHSLISWKHAWRARCPSVAFNTSTCACAAHENPVNNNPGGKMRGGEVEEWGTEDCFYYCS